MSITAADVKALRDQTGAGMMDCKKALTESGGDFEKAIDYLRKKGQKVSAQRADREAKQGLIVAKLSGDNKKAVALELNCETDFVARNEEFIANAEAFAELVFNKEPASTEALRALPFEGKTVADKLELLVGKIGEKIDIGRFEIGKIGEKIDIGRFEILKTEGEIISYIHPGSQLAVLVSFEGPLGNAEVGKDVAMQVAAMNPIATNRDEVDQSTLDKELEIAKEQLINEGKPAEIAEKAAQGKLRRFFEERVLLEQKFVKDGGITVAEYLKQNGAPSVKTFRRIQLGEE
ncbi:MAG: translation elongation factor Ts [Rhodothermaceae bacterium]|nr:translation elongation factor Ts [Rhodothermaceae bacterium]